MTFKPYAFSTLRFLSHEVGIRYIQGFGVEVMLWWCHVGIRLHKLEKK